MTKSKIPLTAGNLFILVILLLLSLQAFAETTQTNPDSIPFAPAVHYQVGREPSSVFSADLDGDGALDLAVVNCLDDNVSILMNNGDGTFQSAVNYVAGSRPYSVFCADLDGDNDLDLAVANYGSNDVSILKNNGDGTFQSAVNYGAGNNPTCVYCADLDGDGDFDLAVTNFYGWGQDVSILKNNGNGTFHTAVNYAAGDYFANSVFCADLDGDIDLDLAVATNYSNNVSILKNNGNGTFQTAVNYVAGSRPYSVFCADLDGDGDLDLAVANNNSNDVSILKNNGDGTFQSPVNYGAGSHPQCVFCADLDGDGYLDLAVQNNASYNVYIFKNNGDGTFRMADNLTLWTYIGPIFCADLDGDGDFDLVVANEVDYASIFINLTVFSPNPNGWQFANEQLNMWPIIWVPGNPSDEFCIKCLPWTRCFPTWDLFRDAFGRDQTEYFSGGKWIRKPKAVERWKSVKGCWKGVCGGFAISSLLFFDNCTGCLQVPTEFPGRNQLYEVELSDQDYKARTMISKYWLYLLGKVQQQYIEDNYLVSATTMLLRIKSMLDNFPRDLRTLYLEGYGSAHSVVPYRWQLDHANSNITYVYVYDPNHPGDNSRRITFHTDYGYWSYEINSENWGGYRGIILMDPMADYTTYPVLSVANTPRERWTDRKAAGVSEFIEFYMSSTDTVLFQCPAGSTGHIGDSLFSTLTQGHPIILPTDERTSPVGYYLPNDAWTCQFSGITDSTFHLSLFTDSTVMVYSRSGVDSTQRENLHYPGNDSSLLVSNPDIGIRSYNFDVVCVAADSEVCYSITNISVDHGDSTRYSMKPASKLQIDNYGGPKEYDLRVEMVGVNGDTTFHHYGITLHGNSSHQIIPDWREYGDSLMILVDSGMVGSFSDTVFVDNDGEYIHGDANGDGVINATDVVYLINYLFISGPVPDPLEAGDVNCDGVVNVTDVVYLINYLFISGPPPGC